MIWFTHVMYKITSFFSIRLFSFFICRNIIVRLKVSWKIHYGKDCLEEVISIAHQDHVNIQSINYMLLITM